MDCDYKIENVEIEGLVIEVDQNPDSADEETKRKKRMGALCVAIRNTAGMKRPEFAQWLGIPYRTYQDWELGNSQVPEYVLRLMAYKVRTENLLKAGKLKYVDDVCDVRQE